MILRRWVSDGDEGDWDEDGTRSDDATSCDGDDANEGVDNDALRLASEVLISDTRIGFFARSMVGAGLSGFEMDEYDGDGFDDALADGDNDNVGDVSDFNSRFVGDSSSDGFGTIGGGDELG